MERSEPSQSSLYREFLAMPAADAFRDFTLVCGDRRFPVSRVALAGDSKLFEGLFVNCDSEEEADRELVLPPVVTAEGLDTLLRHIHNQPLGLNMATVWQVVQAADFLLVDAVTKACNEFICQHIQPCNALEAEERAGFFRLAEVEKRCREVLAEFGEALGSEELLPDLVTPILKMVILNIGLPTLDFYLDVRFVRLLFPEYWGCGLLVVGGILANFIFTCLAWWRLEPREDKVWTWALLLLQVWPQYKAFQVSLRLFLPLDSGHPADDPAGPAGRGAGGVAGQGGDEPGALPGGPALHDGHAVHDKDQPGLLPLLLCHVASLLHDRAWHDTLPQERSLLHPAKARHLWCHHLEVHCGLPPHNF